MFCSRFIFAGEMAKSNKPTKAARLWFVLFRQGTASTAHVDHIPYRNFRFGARTRKVRSARTVPSHRTAIQIQEDEVISYDCLSLSPSIPAFPLHHVLPLHSRAEHHPPMAILKARTCLQLHRSLFSLSRVTKWTLASRPQSSSASALSDDTPSVSQELMEMESKFSAHK